MSGPPASSEGGATLRTELTPGAPVFSSCAMICGKLIAAKARVLVGDASLLLMSWTTAAVCEELWDISADVVADCEVFTEDCPNAIVVPGKANVPGIWNPNDMVNPVPNAPPVVPVLLALSVLLSVLWLAAADSCACASTLVIVACVSATARWATATAAELLLDVLVLRVEVDAVAVGAAEGTAEGTGLATAVEVGTTAATEGAISATVGCAVATGSTVTVGDVATGCRAGVGGVSRAMASAKPGHVGLLSTLVAQGSTPYISLA